MGQLCPSARGNEAPERGETKVFAKNSGRLKTWNSPGSVQGSTLSPLPYDVQEPGMTQGHENASYPQFLLANAMCCISAGCG